eukprot:scaffold2350_cov128-Amphora_coffeaeformis.AAC.3
MPVMMLAVFRVGRQSYNTHRHRHRHTHRHTHRHISQVNLQCLRSVSQPRKSDEGQNYHPFFTGSSVRQPRKPGEGQNYHPFSVVVLSVTRKIRAKDRTTTLFSLVALSVNRPHSRVSLYEIVYDTDDGQSYYVMEDNGGSVHQPYSTDDGQSYHFNKAALALSFNRLLLMTDRATT